MSVISGATPNIKTMSTQKVDVATFKQLVKNDSNKGGCDKNAKN